MDVLLSGVPILVSSIFVYAQLKRARDIWKWIGPMTGTTDNLFFLDSGTLQLL